MENIIDNYSKEELQDLLNNSTSIRNALLQLNVCVSDTTYRHLRRKIKELSLDISKMEQNKKEKGNRPPFTKEEIFCRDSKLKRISGLARYVKKFQVKQFDHCEKCGNSTWLNQPIPLQVHHKDGDNTNNEPENLEILCPNCHALTDTYCGKNIKKKDLNKNFSSPNYSKTKKEKEEYKKIVSKCPSKEELEVKAKEFESLAALGRHYQVSDNTVRNWLNKFDLPYPKREPKKHKPKVNYPTYRVDDIIKTATRWERYLKLPKHKIARYVSQHTKEEIESYIKTFYDKFYLINT